MTFGLQERQGPACPTARRSTLVTIPMLSWKAPQQQRGRLRLPQLLQSLLRRPRPHLSRYYSAARQCTPDTLFICSHNRRAAHPYPLHLVT